MEYINRRGDRYNIFQGMTKTGKPKYFASKRERSEKGVEIASLPGEFEIFEDPGNATVSVRRRKPSRVLPEERQQTMSCDGSRASDITVHTATPDVFDGRSAALYIHG